MSSLCHCVVSLVHVAECVYPGGQFCLQSVEAHLNSGGNQTGKHLCGLKTRLSSYFSAVFGRPFHSFVESFAEGGTKSPSSVGFEPLTTA